MSVIWKYPLAPGEQEIKMPALDQIVHAGPDGNGVPCLWALVDANDDTKHDYKVMVVATGQEFDGSAWRHCKTWMIGPLVFHLLLPAGEN